MPSAIKRLDSAAMLESAPPRWKVGLIALATDSVMECEFAALSPSQDIGVYVSRIPFANPTTQENLLAMAPRLTETAASILPGQRLDVIAYGCTSGTALIGHAAVQASIQAARPGIPVVTPSQAALAAMAALQAGKVGLLAAYIEPVTRALVECFEAGGVEILSPCCLGLESDEDIARIAPDALCEAAERHCPAEAEALFVSCTALRACGVIERLEARLGIPVLTSNQAMFWQCLRQAGCDLPVSGFGRLLERH